VLVERTMAIDKIDLCIIKNLLINARTNLSSIAEDCGVSNTTISNRIETLKKDGIIIKEELMIDPTYFGYKFPISIGINLEPNQEDKIYNLIKGKVKLVGIDHFIGIYDLSIFAYANSLEDLKTIKQLIQSLKGVNDVDILIWNKVHFHFEHFHLDKPDGEDSG